MLKQIHTLAENNSSKNFIKQIHLLGSITGVGFLLAVTIMCEIGGFSAFKNPKQLLTYFGLDPSVNQSGKFTAMEVHMSNCGSRIARRAIFAVALVSIGTKRNGKAINPVLHEFYKKKSSSKPKMVALGSVMHKVCNYIFAVLRNEKPFKVRKPEEYCLSYNAIHPMVA